MSIGQYFYDGNGKRIKKIVGTETTIFVYDALGKLIAEYCTTPPPYDPITSYTATDILGSPRIVTDQYRQVISRRDFMPFGEELSNGTAFRSADQKFIGADSVRQRFTGYEKDQETGLDFAEARYYQNKHGRFTAVDPLLASGKSADPQTFNRYVYVMNQPLKLTDPTGLQAGSSPDEEGPPIRVETQVLGMRWLNKLGFDLFGRISQMLNGGASPTEVYYKTGVSIDTIRAAEFSSQKAQDIDNAVQTIDFTGIWNASGASLRASTGQGSGRDALFANAELAANIFTLPGAGITKQAGKTALSYADNAVSGFIDGSFFGRTTKQILNNIPDGWKKVAADRGNGWKLVDENGHERVRYMRPNAGSKQPWVHNQTGYWRRQNAQGDFLDVNGNVVPKTDPDFDFKTHIPYSGVR